MFDIFNFRIERDGVSYYNKTNDNFVRKPSDDESNNVIQFIYLDSAPLASEFVKHMKLPCANRVLKGIAEFMWNWGPEVAYEWFYYSDSRFVVDTISWCVENRIEFHYTLGDYNSIGHRFPQEYEDYIRSRINEMLEKYELTDIEGAQFLRHCVDGLAVK